MSIYENLGIKTIINAAGPKTRLSGSMMPEEVLDAMIEASKRLVDMEYLQARASDIISRHTGAEAGIVTSGAAAGLTLATAACVTGLDISKMERLPDTTGMKNEVVIARDQRNAYDHTIRAVGVRLVEAGLNEMKVGVGVRTIESWEIDAAITEKTAAIVYVAKPNGIPPLEEVARIARDHDVPVIVDAAAELPPVSNLKKFIQLGASAVVFSGGKAIKGPQASGILCGKREVVSAAILQMLDMDNRHDTWDPPPSLIDKSKLKGIPRHGIGRGFKAGKEEIVGLLTALRLFVEKNHEKERKEYENLIMNLVTKLQGIDRITTRFVPPAYEGAIPMAELKFANSYQLDDLIQFVRKLHAEDPPIYLDETELNGMRLLINPFNLQEDDLNIIANRIRSVIQRRI